MSVPQAPAVIQYAAPAADGLTPSADGFLNGSQSNPSGANVQVNPQVSANPDGLTGSLERNPRVHAPAPAHPRPVPVFANSSADGPFHELKTAPDLQERPTDESGPAEPSAEKPRKRAAPDPEKAAAAAAKRAEAAAERRQLRIAEAAGGLVDLPAVVTRDGAVAPLTLEQADQLLATITSTDQALTVDVEHTGYPTGHVLYELRTAQLGGKHFAVVLDPHQPSQADVARRHLDAAAALHAHVAQADLVPLANAGVLDLAAAWEKMLDTSVPSKLADPGSPTGLKELAPAVLGDRAFVPGSDEGRKALFKAGTWLTDVEPDTPIERSGWAQVDPRSVAMIRYAAGDVLDTAALAEVLPWPDADNLERERTTQRMVSRITEQGLRIDGEHVAELMAQQRADQADAGDRLRAFGIENPGSDQQVAAALEGLGLALPRTPKGKPSVAKGAIEQYARIEGAVGDLVRARLDYQVPKNRIGLFLNHYEQAVTRGDGRVYPTVYTLGARTGRMSCARPNIQQVPRAGGFRACLTADPGELLISADFSGVELRVAAAISQDQALISMLEQGVDLHWEAARQVFGPDATKADRYTVKRGVFGWLYGGQAPTLATQMSVSEPTAQLLIDTLAALLPGVTYWRELTREGVKAGRTQFTSYGGRVIHMPVKAPHAAPNYCIQGTARELLIDALMQWRRTRWGDAVLFPVHDELVVKVPEDQAEEATSTLAGLMASELNGVAIVADPSTPTFAWQDSE
jgi:hypothetical protein